MIFRRREFLRTLAAGMASTSLSGLLGGCRRARTKPNIIFILADDLGYGELGCYGQTKIRTPHLDRLAAQGMRFLEHYSGSPVCAPSRCTLLTGKHTGHASIRDNDELPERGDVWNDPSLEGQRPLLPDTLTLGRLLQQAGYVTACIGKWGLGGPGSTGEPNKQGFDHFYGYLCQRQAHNYYPTHLWRNGQRDILEGNAPFKAHQRLPEGADPADRSLYSRYSGTQYSMDLMTAEALDFVWKNKDRTFFLYLAYPVPHLAIQVPEDSLKEYEGAFPETPYTGDKGYLPHPTPRAGYAAMVTRMDRDVGRLLALLGELELEDNTLVLFSSDNGPTYTGGSDSAFFHSAGPLRGLKGSVYEGGIRVPMIARWPGRIPSGATSGHVSAFWDVMPTLAEAAGTRIPEDIDGISFLPALLGKRGQKTHDFLYWELHSYGGQQAVRMGDWKGIRRNIHKNLQASIELYNLREDLGETRDVASRHPRVVAEIKTIMASRTPSEIEEWNFR